MPWIIYDYLPGMEDGLPPWTTVIDQDGSLTQSVKVYRQPGQLEEQILTAKLTSADLQTLANLINAIDFDTINSFAKNRYVDGVSLFTVTVQDQVSTRAFSAPLTAWECLQKHVGVQKIDLTAAIALCVTLENISPLGKSK